jgi:hypothetical protein
MEKYHFFEKPQILNKGGVGSGGGAVDPPIQQRTILIRGGGEGGVRGAKPPENFLAYVSLIMAVRGGGGFLDPPPSNRQLYWFRGSGGVRPGKLACQAPKDHKD